MKLKNSLFTILSHTVADGRHNFRIRLDAGHFIYKAHFPGQPITPGVCILQMAVELMEEATGRPLALQSAKNVKFLHIISPDVLTEVSYSLQRLSEEDEACKSQIVVSAGDVTYAKLSLVCEAAS